MSFSVGLSILHVWTNPSLHIPECTLTQDLLDLPLFLLSTHPAVVFHILLSMLWSVAPWWSFHGSELDTMQI